MSSPDGHGRKHRHCAGNAAAQVVCLRQKAHLGFCSEGLEAERACSLTEAQGVTFCNLRAHVPSAS